MDPLTLAATLFKAGPAIVRGVGSLFGGKTAEVTEKVAGLVDSVAGVANPEQALAKQLQSLPSEQFVMLEQVKSNIEIELAKVEERREANRLNADTTQYSQSQETIRAEVIHGTDYVKETRPKLARQSFIAGTLYILICEAARLISAAWGGDLPGASMEIAGILYGPCGFYMTMRTIDSFSNKGRS